LTKSNVYVKITTETDTHICFLFDIPTFICMAKGLNVLFVCLGHFVLGLYRFILLLTFSKSCIYVETICWQWQL